jgi:hypothetical protein
MHRHELTDEQPRPKIQVRRNSNTGPRSLRAEKLISVQLDPAMIICLRGGTVDMPVSKTGEPLGSCECESRRRYHCFGHRPKRMPPKLRQESKRLLSARTQVQIRAGGTNIPSLRNSSAHGSYSSRSRCESSRRDQFLVFCSGSNLSKRMQHPNANTISGNLLC